MDINFNGFNEKVLTFMADNTVTEGCLVTMDESGAVTKASADGGFIGVCLNVRNGFAAVQVEGYAETDLTGEVSVGDAILVAASSGVKAAEEGKSYRVIYVGTGVVGFLL
ncbi:MAG: hypothetical protein IJJ15_04460 [Ruminococcus sp.]|nr:hypothetical protein [Ruminococcus sp.]